MISTSVLKKYAFSLAEIAYHEGVSVEVKENLKGFSSLLENIPELFDVLKSPILPLDVKKRIINKITSKIGFHEYTTNFLSLLVEHHRIVYFPEIFILFLQTLDDLEGIIKPKLYTIKPLSNERKENLIKGLSKVFNARIVLEQEVDPAIIGGLKLELGNTIYDGTIKRQLERLKEKLAAME